MREDDAAYKWLFQLSSCSRETPYMRTVLHSVCTSSARSSAAQGCHAMQRVLLPERVNDTHAHRLQVFKVSNSAHNQQLGTREQLHERTCCGVIESGEWAS